MRIATFNINGVKARAAAVPAWLEETAPDIACLQELKSVDEAVPTEPWEALGYNVALHGQKSFNGVAILSKHPLEDVSRGLPGDPGDDQARWIEAWTGGVRVGCLYLPNGNPAPGPKYDYKLAWMARLAALAEEWMATEEPCVLAGDYNVIPQPEDVARPADWRDDALFRPESRALFHRLCHTGWTDALRAIHPTGAQYSYWDYQRAAFDANDGIRIDHLLLSPEAADRLRDAGVDRDMRGRSKPSDHAPVWIELDL